LEIIEGNMRGGLGFVGKAKNEVHFGEKTEI
jgi:hypothetical protein